MENLRVYHTEHRLLPDAHRVIARPFLPDGRSPLPERPRVRVVLERVLSLPEGEVPALLAAVRARLAHRHGDLDGILLRHFEMVAPHVPVGTELSRERRLLIGAYFTQEYAFEGTALTNPSMVAAPDQSGLEPSEQRFVLSLRAIGEGHISSIEFRSGVIDAEGRIRFDPVSPYAVTGQRRAPVYDKGPFRAKLAEMGADSELVERILKDLRPRFTLAELEHTVATASQHGIAPSVAFETLKAVRWLATSNYVSTFPESSDLTERVLFPAGPLESQGMEDARFVRFMEDDGSTRYYATYTAYDGFTILPQLIATADFRTFRIATMYGPAAQNKGMALFPRRIGGRYVALGRHDRESIHVMRSSQVRYWEETYRVRVPSLPWELVQIGNCGSPLETEAGWLVLTHGVGPMRRYTIGALLLDRDNPRRLIAALPQPLLEPEGSEREGYVPNVVYSCGALIHRDWLVLPYGFGDRGTAIALIRLEELLEALLRNRVAD